MNALFLINEPIRDFSGIAKKILAQVNALKNLGVTVFLSYLEENGKYRFTGRFVDQTLIDKYSGISFFAKLQRRCSYNHLFKFIKANNIQLVYIRYIHFANPFFISFLKKLKSQDIVILLELPTYPYDKEYKNISLPAKLRFYLKKFTESDLRNM